MPARQGGASGALKSVRQAITKGKDKKRDKEALKSPKPARPKVQAYEAKKAEKKEAREAKKSNAADTMAQKKSGARSLVSKAQKNIEDKEKFLKRKKELIKKEAREGQYD